MHKNLLLGTLLLLGLLTAFETTLPDSVTAASKPPQKARDNKAVHKAAIDTALRYAEAIAKGDKITSITIHEDTTDLFTAQKDNLEHWNSILDRAK